MEALKQCDVESHREQELDRLCARFSARAASIDQEGIFAQDNYADLKQSRFFSLGIPVEYGGAGLRYDELCQVVRKMGQACGSTALAFAMHSHPVALNVFKSLKGDAKAQATLQKIAASELIIAGTGANDWLASNGTATPVEGGYRVNAHKRFVSGGPAAQILVSSVHYESDQGSEVLHFSLPFSTPGIHIQNNWDTLGMRGTGSNDVILENVFLPEAAIVARRPAGQWHVIWDTILPIAMPLICSVYVGLAEAAHQLALEACAGKPALAGLAGRMNNQLTSARLALNDMVERQKNYRFVPHAFNTETVLTRKTLVYQSVLQTVELASTLVGGSGYFRGHPLERIVRDVRAMHFHPLPEHKQTAFSGRVLMGLDPGSELP